MRATIDIKLRNLIYFIRKVSRKIKGSNDYYKFAVESLLISLTVLVFSSPYDWYIFGQDSIPFVHVFSFYADPLYAYNDNLSAVYYDMFISLIQNVFGNIEISERIVMMIFVFLSSFFLLDLFKIILAFYKDVKFPYATSVIPVLFYEYNLFTLSITWPHILTWTLLMVSAPIIISFLTYTLFHGINIRRFILTTGIMFIFAGSISVDYLPFFLIVIIVFMTIGIFSTVIFKNHRRKYAYSTLTMLIFATLIAMWGNLPSYFSVNYSSLQSQNPTFFLLFAQSESIHTKILNVISLSGYSWLYGGPPYGQGAYPWYSYFYLLKTMNEVLIPVIIILSFYVLFRNKRIRPLAVIALLSVAFSTGTNFPFGSINEFLLKFKGPFSFLINPYYFTLQFYVLFLSVVIFMLLFYVGESFKDKVEENVRDRVERHKVGTIKKKTIEYIVVFLILLLLASNLYPFLSDNVYQKQGDNINMVDMKNGLITLDGYLVKNYSSPEYLSVLLPLSSLSGHDRLLYNGNGSFADSVGMVQSFDPYPLIWQDNSNIATLIENYFGDNNFLAMSLVMQYFHIKYIIYTNDYPRSYGFMEKSPDGEYYNMSYIYNNLVNNFGEPKIFGNYSLFTVPRVLPIAGTIRHPEFANVNFSQYVNFLSDINSSRLNSTMNTDFESVLPSSSVPNMYIYAYNVSKTVYFIGNSNKFFSVNSYGNFSSLMQSSIENESNNGSIFIAPRLIYNLSNQEYNYFQLEDPVMDGEMINLSFVPNMVKPGQRIDLQSRFGQDYVNVSIYNYSRSYDLYLSANFRVIDKNGNYAWDNIVIPNNVKISNISIWYRANHKVTVFYSSSDKCYRNVTTFYYGADNYILNMGYSTTNFIKNVSINTTGIFSIQGGPFHLSTLRLYSIPLLKFIVSYNMNTHPSFESEDISTTIFGNYNIKTSLSNGSYLYLFGFQYVPKYAKLNSGTYEPVYVSNSIIIFNFSSLNSSNAIIYLNEDPLTKMSFYLSIAEIFMIGVVGSAFAFKKYRNKK